MEVGEPLEDGLEDAGDFVFVELALGDIDEIDDAAGVAILENDPQVVILLVVAVVSLCARVCRSRCADSVLGRLLARGMWSAPLPCAW